MMTQGDLEQLASAWERFQRSGDIDESVVRPEIASSWARCRRMALDPRAAKPPVKLNPAELAALQRESAVFMEAALPFVEFLKTAVKGTGFILVLTDAKGLVLETFGDPEDIGVLARENNYVPGCYRGEEELGTNAICLALIERKPIQLTGPEHWNVRNHRWTCASAPVFDPEGTLLGTVTLSGQSIHAHHHTLGMVISAAEAIQRGLRERVAHLDKRRVDAMLTSLLASISEAIVTIDHGGIVTNVNGTAARMLGTSPEEALGKSVLKLFPESPKIIGVLEPQRESTSIEVTDARRGRSPLIVTPYLLKAGDAVQGAILFLRERREFLAEVRELSGFNAVFTFEDIVGSSPPLVRQIELARITSRQSSRVLITGETGTGKELFAQAIHNASPRRGGPFVAVNCAAIPRELLESEIFGYKGGAFTGSRKGGQIGKLELADGGTIFLDEINQMPLDLQSKLLRVLQDGTITRLGDTRPIRVDARVVAATNEDLFAKSRAGEFRQDLYFRLAVVEINLPPLRERVGDIPLVAQYLLRKLSRTLGRGELVLSKEALERLLEYEWPGNIRELENVLEMSSIIAEGKTIEPSHLAYRMRKGSSAEPGPAAPIAPASPAQAQAQPIREVEIDLIRSTMKELRGNVAEAARKLGISRSTIYRRMKDHGITKSVKVE